MIKIFVGCAANNEDAESCAVLEYTIRKHASEPIEIEWMRLSRDPNSIWNGWNSTAWHTPFTGFRWGIPAFCNYAGRAIYSDSDVIVLDDIAKLWNAEIKPGSILAANPGGKRNRYDVFVWDCAAANGTIPSLKAMRRNPSVHKDMTGMLRVKQELVTDLPDNWDCIDGKGWTKDEPGNVKAIHYSRMSSQPHLRHALARLKAQGKKHWFPEENIVDHPRTDLVEYFDELLVEAKAAGFTPEKYAPAVPYGDYKKRDLTHQR